MNKLLLLLFTCFSVANAGAQSFIFAQLTGSPVNTTDWNMTGNAYVGNTSMSTANNSEIILTNPNVSESGAIFCTNPINIVQCDKWTVDFEFRMFDGNGADGIAFCLLDVPPSGFVGGGGCGIPGTSNGLKIVFDTYNNCGAANPAIQIRWGAGYAGGECDYSQPTLDNSGQLGFIRSNAYNAARIEYDGGQVDVYVNNVLYLSGNYVINFTTYAGFTASTGGAYDRQSIRNVVIRTEMADPMAYSGPNGSTCSNQPLQIGGPTNPNYQYQWIPATGLDNPNISNPTLTLTNNTSSPQTYMYKVGANIIGTSCVQYDSVYITVNPIPTGTFTTDAPSYCINQTANITYTGTASSGAIYNWIFDNGIVTAGSGQGPYQVSWPTSGTKNLRLTVTDNNCPSPPFALPVPVYDYPTSDFTLPTGVCPDANANIQYTGNAANTATYNWNFNGGTVNTGTGQGPYTVSWPSPGNPSVSLTVTENGCTSQPTQHSLLIYTIPTAAFTAQPTTCEFQAAVVNYTGTGTNTATYTWNFDTGGAVPIGGENYNVLWPSAGTKTVSLTVTENGCTSLPFTQSVIVYPIPTAIFTLTPTVCQNADAQAVYTGTSGVGATYNWFWNGGNTTQTGAQSYDVNWANAGTYPVLLTVTENGCQSVPYAQIATVNFQPTAAIDFNPTVCVNDLLAITFTGLALPTSTYTWDADGGTLTGTGQGPVTASWIGEGTKTISLTVDEGGCTSTISQNVTVAPLPTTKLEPHYNICLGEELALDPGSFAAYEWNGGSTDRIMDADLAGNYTVNVTDNNGCENTFTTVVTDTVCLSLYIPNAFTPDGDHHNDVFKPVIEYPIDYTLRIYNRWGELLFTSINNANAFWDGTLNGKVCPTDVYVYNIEFSGYENQRIIKGIKKGTVTLIR